MSETIIIKNIDSNRINYIIGIIKNTKYKENSLLTITKTEKNRSLEFLNLKNFVLRLENNILVIESIVIEGQVKIKDASNRLSNVIENRFNIVKTYVATTRKGIVNKGKEFYSRVKDRVEKPKLIFDISKETNLIKSLSSTEDKQIVENVIPQNGDKVQVVKRDLIFKNDFCQRVNENASLVMRLDFETMVKIKKMLGIPENVVSKENPKKLTKTKGGYVSIILLATIAASVMAVIARIVTDGILE